MRFKDMQAWGKWRQDLNIGSAVEIVCEGGREDPAESGRAELLGRLVAELHNAGVLSDDAVLRVLGPRFEQTDAADPG